MGKAVLTSHEHPLGSENILESSFLLEVCEGQRVRVELVPCAEEALGSR